MLALDQARELHERGASDRALAELWKARELLHIIEEEVDARAERMPGATLGALMHLRTQLEFLEKGVTPTRY